MAPVYTRHIRNTKGQGRVKGYCQRSIHRVSHPGSTLEWRQVAPEGGAMAPVYTRHIRKYERSRTD